MSDNTNQVKVSPRGDLEGAVTVVKVGGAVVEDPEQLAALLENFSNIEGKKVLVHGGGRRATKVAASLGIESIMIGGRRVTDAKMLEVVTMVYGGLVNKNLVASLQARGINAIGLTGADMNVICSHKRPLKKMNIDGKDEMVDFGFVGDVDKADGVSLKTLVEAGITPIMAPLTHDGNGNILNTNADTIASETAKALASVGYDVTLIYSFEKKGVLSNPDDDDSVIPVITHESFEQYKADGTISGGMLPKIENALAAIDAGVSKVVITLATAIDGNSGTVIK
ncbi:MAG: acetylglutamate kinase [Prevotella sp.]|nr:acetylglutamate kinase [Prevotella sp.]